MLFARFKQNLTESERNNIKKKNQKNKKEQKPNEQTEPN